MQPVETKNAPSAIGTYSQAIIANDLVFLSGQIPLDPITMELCSQEITVQIHQVFKNLSAVCVAAGGNLANVLKLTIYLKNLDYFPLINEIMPQYFAKPYPARAVIGVADLPKGSQIEIDGVMILDINSIKKPKS